MYKPAEKNGIRHLNWLCIYKHYMDMQSHDLYTPMFSGY